MSAVIHTLHVVLAGAWLGGVIFTTAVVSPALKTLKWTEPERVAVRSVIGRRYAQVGSANLVLLLLFAFLDGLLFGEGASLYVECALLVVLFGLVAAHGACFGRRLVGLAEAEKEAKSAEEARALAGRRHRLQDRSLWVSRLIVLVSLAVMVLAVGV